MMVASVVAAKDLTLELWQVAFWTGLSQPIISRMMGAGEVQSVMVDGRRLVPGAELARLLRKQFGPKPALRLVGGAEQSTLVPQ